MALIFTEPPCVKSKEAACVDGRPRDRPKRSGPVKLQLSVTPRGMDAQEEPFPSWTDIQIL